MISLTVVRIIQNKIVQFKGKNPSKNWKTGLIGIRLQKALNDWKVCLYTDNLHRFDNIDDGDLKLLLDAFNIKIDPDLYTKADLRSIKTHIQIV